MKPPLFQYVRPGTLPEALEQLDEAKDSALLLAGGQSLMPLLNMRLARPDLLIDLNEVEELSHIDVADSSVTVGAMTRLAATERSDAIRQSLPVLAEAALHVAHPQIRNRTTLGGTLCHADPSAEMPTVAVALGATLELQSLHGGSRQVAADDFYESLFATTRRPDEVLVSVSYPRYPGHAVAFREIARRHGDFPFVGLCLVMRVEAGVVTFVRAAAAGVSDRPVRLLALEGVLAAAELNGGTVQQAADAAGAEVDPTSDGHGTAAFRRSLLRSLVRGLLSEQVAA